MLEADVMGERAFAAIAFVALLNGAKELAGDVLRLSPLPFHVLLW
jgi:hypothetical protein